MFTQKQKLDLWDIFLDPRKNVDPQRNITRRRDPRDLVLYFFKFH